MKSQYFPFIYLRECDGGDSIDAYDPFDIFNGRGSLTFAFGRGGGQLSKWIIIYFKDL